MNWFCVYFQVSLLSKFRITDLTTVQFLFIMKGCNMKLQALLCWEMNITNFTFQFWFLSISKELFWVLFQNTVFIFLIHCKHKMKMLSNVSDRTEIGSRWRTFTFVLMKVSTKYLSRNKAFCRFFDPKPGFLGPRKLETPWHNWHQIKLKCVHMKRALWRMKIHIFRKKCY